MLDPIVAFCGRLWRGLKRSIGLVAIWATWPILAAHGWYRQRHWIITSSEALRGLVGLLEELDRLDATDAVVQMQQQHLIVPHARIAQTATALGFTRITQTGSGDERLLAALQLQS